MPELPEVETTVKDLRKRIISRKIEGCWIGVPLKCSILSDFNTDNFEEIIKGKTVKNVRRKGKNIIIDLSSRVSVLIHQKISGHVLLGRWERESDNWVSYDKLLSEKVNSFIHFMIFLTNKNMVAVSDPRKFFKVELWKTEDLEDSKTMKALGQDALKIGFSEFREGLNQRRQEIKKLLIGQNFISGIGNIYSDEMLWEAKISPFRKANSLDKKEIKSLFKSMSKILKKAISLKGDSTSDYRLINGKKGGYQNYHNVYQRDGQPCKRKDGGIIIRKKFGNRSLRFCPICQKQP